MSDPKRSASERTGTEVHRWLNPPLAMCQWIGKSWGMQSGVSRVLSAVTGLWGPRILWLAVGVSGVWSIGHALDDRSAAIRTTVMVGAWLVWGLGVVALVVPSPLGLTVMRMASALACGAAVLSWTAGAAAIQGAVFLACVLICGFLVGGADFGQQCIQASAYGDERRFLLRPPAAFLPPIALGAVVWAGAVLAAPLLVASEIWIIGILVAIVAMLLTVVLLPRFNALARRWLVFVPAGIVVHDQVVLGETLMVPRDEFDGIELALVGTEAADFTGPAGGHAIEVRMRSLGNALLAPTKAAPRGTALHMRSFIIAPTRPGLVLRAFRDR